MPDKSEDEDLKPGRGGRVGGGWGVREGRGSNEWTFPPSGHTVSLFCFRLMFLE